MTAAGGASEAASGKPGGGALGAAMATAGAEPHTLDRAEPHTLDRAAALAALEADRFARTAARIDRLVALIDARLSAQVDAILHHPRFQALEAAWRGVALLLRTGDSVGAGGTAGGVEVRLLDASWRELSRAMDRAAEFDQSHLFDLVYSQEFGTAGGTPFGLLVGAYEVSHAISREGDPVGTLGALASVAAASFCPFVAGAAPALFEMDGFGELADMPDLARALQTDRLARWNRLRAREDARFLGLVAPRILLREPYRGPTRRRLDGFVFEESVDPRGRTLLWGTGAFAFAAVAIRQFEETGWFADIRGAPQDAEGGGLVPTLDPYDFGTDRHGLSAQPAVEARLSALQETQLASAGIVGLGTLFLSDRLVLNANPSLHRPPRYDRAEAEQSARLAAMLQYVLCASRFAHYLKVIMRDEVGSRSQGPALQRRLGEWLAGYCLGNEDASEALRARHPLRAASVAVREVPGRPGAYGCVVRLQPHFQLDDVSTSFQLVAETVEGAA